MESKVRLTPRLQKAILTPRATSIYLFLPSASISKLTNRKMTWTTLHDACEHQDNAGIVSRSGSNPEEAARVDDHGSTPLHILCWGNPLIPTLRALVEAHPYAVTERDLNGDTPLHVALFHCGRTLNAEVVRCLIDARPAVASVGDREGLLPIHAACRYCPKNEEVVEILVNANPLGLRKNIKIGEPAPKRHKDRHDPHLHAVVDGNPRAPSSSDLRFSDSRRRQVRDGAYPLHMAVARGAPHRVVQILVENAPDVLVLKDKYGRTPLHVAVRFSGDQPPSTIRYLIASNPSPLSMADREGFLPLHTACESGASQETITLLIQACPSSINAVNNDGKRPVEMLNLKAGDKYDPNVFEILEKTTKIQAA